jgi:hypothetical protein
MSRLGQPFAEHSSSFIIKIYFLKHFNASKTYHQKDNSSSLKSAGVLFQVYIKPAVLTDKLLTAGLKKR